MHPNDASRGHSLALFPLAAVALLMIGGALTPSGLDQPIRSLHTARSELRVATMHPDRLYLATCFILLGLGALAVAFVAIATLCVSRRGSVLAAVAVALAGVASLCGVVVNSLVGLNLAGVARTRASTEAATQLLLSTNTPAAPTAILIIYIGGLALASVLIAVALWRARIKPRWLGMLFPITLIVASLAPPGPVGVLLSVPFAAVMVLLSVRIWRAAHPAPLTVPGAMQPV